MQSRSLDIMEQGTFFANEKDFQKLQWWIVHASLKIAKFSYHYSSS